MAFLAGATDVCGLARLHDLFVSFMSGNTTMLAVALARPRSRAGTIAGLIALFVVGLSLSLGTIIAVLSRRRHIAVVSLAVGIVLLVPLRWQRHPTTQCSLGGSVSVHPESS
jgi:uncharacterized membrane protein YoaK (UPF0700 family)